MAEVLLNQSLSTIQPPPSERPHHPHRVFPPSDYVSKMEEKLKARRKLQEKERERHLEALLADAATKGSSDSMINESLLKFVDDKNAQPKLSGSIEKTNKTESAVKSTSSTSPGSLPLPLPTQPALKVPNSEEDSSSGKDDGGEFGEIVSAVWGKVKGMIGFTPDCLNGGTKRLGGKCFCPEYFLGDHCEKPQCLNNGTLLRISSTIPVEEMCKCPNPLYITGRHCETIHCQNGGRPLSNGSCKCIDNWYTGQFCEYYAASWFAVLGIPLICIAVIALCCVICRLDFCPKRTSTTVNHSHRRRNRVLENRRHHYPYRHHAHGHDEPHTMMIHENLLSDCQQHFRRPPSNSHSAGHIVRLENIPVYNPSIPHLPGEEYKPLEPPPKYEEAIANCPTISTPLVSTRAMPPPIYSPPRNEEMTNSPSSSREGSPPPLPR